MKGHLLYWGDAPTVSTGFGVVARHVLGALAQAGYTIDCLGLNCLPDFPDRERFPYAIVAAGVPGQDPLGYRALVRSLLARPYDLLLAQNDLPVLHTAAAHLTALAERGASLPPIACYYPVDCMVRPDLTSMLDLADAIVTCTEHGRRETAKALIGGRAPLVIPHGVDTRAFRPLEPRERAAASRRFRAQYNIDPQAMLVSSVAVNSVRKDLARTIAAFARWSEAFPRPAVLYLHTAPVDNGLDLLQAASASGLIVGHDVIFPDGHHVTRGIPEAALNELYNASDLYFTTTLGEGWGLPITEAMAAGLPVVAPRCSALEEHGAEGRAVLYECRESVWVDNTGYRPLGLMDDIVAALARAAAMSDGERRRMTEATRAYAASLDWSAVAPRWLPVIGGLVAARRERPAAGAAALSRAG
jgi:glycosyltransferase involved in cell wall biosynthesis